MPGGFSSSADACPCPCGGGVYRLCCAPLHRGLKRAETAEELMRSRYSAFARTEVGYLLATHPEPGRDDKLRRAELLRSCRQTHWLGLTIREVRAGGSDDLEGTVEFEARYRGGVLKEISLIQRRKNSVESEWIYAGAESLSI